MSATADLDADYQDRIIGSARLQFEACDWLADRGIEELAEGMRTWDAPGYEVAELIAAHYPAGAQGFIRSVTRCGVSLAGAQLH